MKVSQKKPNNTQFLKKSLFLSTFALAYASSTLVAGAFSFADIFDIKAFAAGSQKPRSEENIQNMDLLGEDSFKMNTPEKTSLLGKMLSFNQTSLDADTKLDEETNHAHDESAIYTVKKGESIQSIASYFEVSVDTIVTFNKLDETKVYEGDVLEIPHISGILYTIKKGDTLENVSEYFKLDMEDVSLYNGLIPGIALEVGEDIFLPGAKLAKKEEKKETKKTTKTTTKSKDSGKRTTASDVQAISKLKKESGKYSQMQRLDGYFTNPAPSARRSQKMHGHNGVDLAGPVGTSILAAAGGTVTVARDTGWNYGYGKYIVVSHPNGTQTVYAHLSSIEVSVGQTVGKGQRIAAMGNTGNSTGPHLHFEVRGAYNPFAW